jgi:hypothetical protein
MQDFPSKLTAPVLRGLFFAGAARGCRGILGGRRPVLAGLPALPYHVTGFSS